MSALSIRPARIAALTLAALLCTGHFALAGTRWWVGNDGVDSASCGAQAHPCRSITQAMEIASDGDHILVGAGHYGDVSGSGTYTGPGDEHPGLTGCLVCITKALQIDSIDGASVTVIEGNLSAPLASAVQILHDGVIFGYPGHGFTLTGKNAVGVNIDLNAAGALAFQAHPGVVKGISVGGNVDVGDGTGFGYNGPSVEDGTCLVCRDANTGEVLFSDNQSIGGGFSVTINGLSGPGLIVLRNNLALNAGTGFEVDAGIQTITALEVSGTGQVQLLNNVATGGQVGFATNRAGPIEGNTASYNAIAGFIIVPAGLIQHNSAIGNGGPGMIVQFSPDPFTSLSDGPVIAATINNNNFFGNDRNRPVLSLTVGNGITFGNPYNPGPSAHCGILNVGWLAPLVDPQVAGPAPPGTTVTAHFDYWGSSKGPQASGSGDEAGGACDQNNGVTKSTPFNATAFTVDSFQP